MRAAAARPRLPVVDLGLLLAAIVALQLGFDESSLLYLAPALLLLVPLACGRYPGERLLRAISARRRSRATAPRMLKPRRSRFLAPLPRGGELLAAALAGRAPPPRRASTRLQEPKKGRTKMRRIAITVVLACALLAPASASAHVSLHPNEVPSGAFATLDIRVPNESDTANTTKLAVQVPSGFTDVSPEYLPGWSVEVRSVKLAKPVKTSDGLVTEGVREVVWSGHGADGRIPPGQFLDFPISTEIPGQAGQALTFKVLQYYDDGEVARWIGSPESENPAPSIDVTAPGGVLEDVAGTEAAPPAPGAAHAAGEAGEAASGGGASNGLAIAALAIGALGLLAGGTALVRSRRPRGAGA